MNQMIEFERNRNVIVHQFRCYGLRIIGLIDFWIVKNGKTLCFLKKRFARYGRNGRSQPPVPPEAIEYSS